MINAKFRYLRPGNLFKEFIIESNEQKLTEGGRVVNSCSGDGVRMLKGCLAEASPNTKQMWGQLGHSVTHTIEQPGSPKAKSGDVLILGDREFYIEGIDDAGSLGIAVMYYVKELKL